MALRTTDGKVINTANNSTNVEPVAMEIPHPTQVTAIVFTSKLHMHLIDVKAELAAALWVRPSLFHAHSNTGGMHRKWSEEGVYFSEQLDRNLEGDVFYKYVLAKDGVEFNITDTDNYWTYQNSDMSQEFMAVAIDILTTVQAIICRVSKLGEK